MSTIEFSEYVITEKTIESKFVTSFILEPKNGAGCPVFFPGQHVALRLENGLIRTYTVSSNPYSRTHLRISVKREISENNQATNGVGSNFIHDRFDVGSEVDVSLPRGNFHLQLESDRPVVLLSGGVGITPMISMLHHLASGTRPVLFVHACKNRSEHSFAPEVAALKERSSHIETIYFYKNQEGYRSEDTNMRSGLIDSAFIHSLQLAPKTEFYICGPNRFMASVFNALIESGIEKDQIRFEFFSDPVDLSKNDTEDTDQAAVITFVKSGLSVPWNNFPGSLLEFAEKHGIKTESSCRSGACGTCECLVRSGDLKYFAEPLDPPLEDHAFLCITRPASSTIELDI